MAVEAPSPSEDEPAGELGFQLQGSSWASGCSVTLGQTGLRLLIPLLPLPECWGFSHALPCLARAVDSAAAVCLPGSNLSLPASSSPLPLSLSSLLLFLPGMCLCHCAHMGARGSRVESPSPSTLMWVRGLDTGAQCLYPPSHLGGLGLNSQYLPAVVAYCPAAVSRASFS